jgi:hypothetical protein
MSNKFEHEDWIVIARDPFDDQKRPFTYTTSKNIKLNEAKQWELLLNAIRFKLHGYKMAVKEKVITKKDFNSFVKSVIEELENSL